METQKPSVPFENGMHWSTLFGILRSAHKNRSDKFPVPVIQIKHEQMRSNFSPCFVILHMTAPVIL